uniref:Facilitated trehalose transporter Tret1 n=2 Tax=Cacopsylla melanoneura TaxID=428564 RepID=A0A8D8ZHF9_9HEMI
MKTPDVKRWLVDFTKRLYVDEEEEDAYPIPGRNDEQIQNVLWREVTACLSAALFHIPNGLSLSYAAVLIPQLEKVDSEIPISKSDSAWIASLIGLVVPIASLLTGYLMDYIGRLRTIQISVVPFVAGFFLMGTAASFEEIILGRILTAVAMAMGTNPSIVYTAEIARPNLRGSVSSAGPLLSSFGLLMGYTLGFWFSWRDVALISSGVALFPLLLTFVFSAESPEWLLSTGKTEQALKTLQFLTDDTSRGGVADKRFDDLEQNILSKQQKHSETSLARVLKAYFSPAGYKPLLILMVLFTFQQLSGIYITISYAVTFFEDVSVEINGSLSSIYLGLSRFIGGIFAVYMLKTVNRRPLLMISSLIMAIFMFISGYYSMLISQGLSSATWVPIVCILGYMFTSTIGLFSVPWVMTAEIFPLRFRGILQGTAISWAYVALFFAVRSYRPLLDLLGGVYAVQWLFGLACILAIVFVWIFLPETHNQNLDQIEEYFVHNFVYLGKKRAQYTRIGS